MVKIIVLLPFFLLVFNVAGQFEIDWSETQDFHIKYSTPSPVISGDNNENHIIQSNTGKKRYYSTWSGTNKMAEIDESFNGKLFSEYVEPINYFFLGEQLIRISRAYLNGAWRVIYEKKSPNLVSEEQPVEIAEITTNKDWYSILNAYQSKNQDFLVIYWQNETSNGAEVSSLGYIVLNKSLSVHSSGEFSIPFDAKKARMNKLFLSDQGDLFALFSEYSIEVHAAKLMSDDWQFMQETPDFQKMYACKIDGSKTITVEIDLNHKRLQDMVLHSKEKNQLSIVSTYGAKGVKWREDFTSGFAYLNIDFDEQEINTEKYLSFSTEVIENNASLDLKSNPKLIKAQTGIKRLFMRDVFFLENGQIVGSAEHSEFWPVSTTAQGTVPSHKSCNILVFNFKANGDSGWLTQIEKGQIALSNRFCKTSYKSFIKENKIHFLFLDIATNYDANKSFNTNKELDWIEIDKKSTRSEQILADAVIGIERGDIVERTILLDNLNDDFSPLPKSFFIDKNGNIAMIAIDSKTKSLMFGILKWI